MKNNYRKFPDIQDQHNLPTESTIIRNNRRCWCKIKIRKNIAIVQKNIFIWFVQVFVEEPKVYIN